jgi:tetratricopeptide (TPR) repeat protein
MYILLISIAAAVATTVATGFIFGGGEFEFWYGIVPGLIVFVGLFIYLARRILNQMQSIVGEAQREFQNQNIDRGIEVLEAARPLSKWQFFLGSQIDGQIGSVLYMAKRFDEAESYLRRSFKKNWVSRAQLGVLYYKKKKYDDMKEVFEEAVSANKKESLLWNLYAYCLWKQGNRDDAISVLNRAVDAIEGDDKTERNLKALKNNRKMKMRGWNMMWYQFHLDRPPMARQQQFRRR